MRNSRHQNESQERLLDEVQPREDVNDGDPMSDSTRPIHPETLLSHRNFVRGLARALVSDPDLAEDLVQETWLVALRRPPRNTESPLSWLAAVTRSLAGSFYRNEGRRDKRERTAARREAVESTDEIVERLSFQKELVDAVLRLRPIYRETLVLRYFEERSAASIARDLGLPEATVRARVRRGLSQLREHFETRYPKHETWMAALATVGQAGLDKSFFPTTCGTANLTTSTKLLTLATRGGGLVMSSKLGWTAAASVLLLLGAWFVGTRSSGLPNPVNSPQPAAPRLLADLDQPEPETDSGDALSNSAAAPSPVAAIGAEVPTPPQPNAHTLALDLGRTTDPGHVLIRAVDGTDGAEIPVTTRFLSLERFAEVSGKGSQEIVLTPGVYEASLSAKGYEPVTLASFNVNRNEGTDLGTIALRRGTGRIEGQVLAHHLRSDEPVVLELYGDGRHRCLDCASIEPAHRNAGEGIDPSSENAEEEEEEVADPTSPPDCEFCGYQKDKSVLSRHAGELFSFPALSQGTYFLRAFQKDREPIGKVHRVEILEGRWEWLDLDFSPSTTVEFELVDPEGFPVHIAATEPMSFVFSHRGLEVARARHGRNVTHLTRSYTRLVSSLLKMQASNKSPDSGTPSNGSSLWSQNLLDPSQIRVDLASSAPVRDRRREPEDSLLPPANRKPDLGTVYMEATRWSGNLFQVDGIPRKVWTVRGEGRQTSSEEVLVDLRDGHPRRVQLVLSPRSNGITDWAQLDSLALDANSTFLNATSLLVNRSRSSRDFSSHGDGPSPLGLLSSGITYYAVGGAEIESGEAGFLLFNNLTISDPQTDGEGASWSFGVDVESSIELEIAVEDEGETPPEN